MRLAVDRIRQPEITVMTDHLREEHPELRLDQRAMLGEVLYHFHVTPTHREQLAQRFVAMIGVRLVPERGH